MPASRRLSARVALCEGFKPPAAASFRVAAVFPWTRDSPVVALVLILGAAAYVIGLAAIYQILGRRVFAAGGVGAQALDRLPTSMRATLRRAVAWTTGILTAYLGMFALTRVWQPITQLVYEPAIVALPEVLAIAAILLGASLLLESVAILTRYFAGESERRPRRPLNAQVLHVLERFFRYVIFASAGTAVIIAALSAFGYSGNAEEAVLAWFQTQAGSLVLLATLIGIGWAGSRITRAVTSEVRYTSQRFSPQVIDAMGAVVRGAMFTVLGLVGIITLLNAVGQGAIGGTLVVVLTSFIGLTVAMAGTGSIGNALSGAVLISFRPYDRGDRVIISDGLTCDVEEVSLMFTKVRTLARETLEVPNNQILAKPIVNLSRSGPHAVVVKMGIGYDVSHDLVRRLAVEATLATDGFVNEPAPKLHARNFGSYAIEYELYAYTRNPRHLDIRSALLGKLQETFYGAGVEIMTPDIYVLRKGKTAEGEGYVRVAVDAPLRSHEARDAAAPNVTERGSAD